MKLPRRTLRLLVAIVLLFVIAAGLHAWFTPKLPHQMLRGGGEFRVFAVRYGAGSDAQAYLRAPKWKFRMWQALPRFLQNLIPYPEIGPLTEFWDHPSVAIWCAWVNPKTHLPEINEIGKATVMLDNGKSLPEAVSDEDYHSAHPPSFTTDWPVPAGDYREIMIVDPPHDSRYFHVKIDNFWGETHGETVHFTIENPAYRQP